MRPMNNWQKQIKNIMTLKTTIGQFQHITIIL